MPRFRRKPSKGLSGEEIVELNDLLFLDSSADDAGILNLARNSILSGDLHLNKIARVKELIGKL